jgi:hypothetical protein
MTARWEAAEAVKEIFTPQQPIGRKRPLEAGAGHPTARCWRRPRWWRMEVGEWPAQNCLQHGRFCPRAGRAVGHQGRRDEVAQAGAD